MPPARCSPAPAPCWAPTGRFTTCVTFGGIQNGQGRGHATDRRAMDIGPCAAHHHADLYLGPARGDDRQRPGPPRPPGRGPVTARRGRAGIPARVAGRAVPGRITVTAAAQAEAKTRAADGRGPRLPDRRDLFELRRQFPPRANPASWPETRASRGGVLARVLAAPFTFEDANYQADVRRGI